MRQLVFISTAWGAQLGGINSFNYDVCLSIGRLLKGIYKVICVVQDAKFDKLIDVVKLERDENILIIKSFEGEDPEDIVQKLKSKSPLQIDCWIGHDVITGGIANLCATITKSKSAVIHHMDYSQYKTYDNEKTAVQVNKKVQEQENILASASIVFAVGPTLKRSATRKLYSKNQEDKEVHELVPGMASITPLNKINPQFEAITYGRLEDEMVKRGKVAIGAFARAVNNSSLSLHIYGVSETDEYEKVYTVFRN